MKRDIARLKAEHFDILVIGAGINGCAIARDAALRGAKVALIEKDDFASGASGKTTKLIHGGIRYLEQFNFKLVYEALRERAILLKTVPHLVRPLEFIIPVYKNDPRSLFKINTGVSIYDWLAGSNNIRPHRHFTKDEVILLEPNIETRNLKGVVLYSDAQMDDVRLCLDNAISAYAAGASVANKTEATGFIKEKGRISGVEALDKLSGEKFLIRSRIILNATGAWSNKILRWDNPDAPAITRPTKGIHIIYRKLPHQRAILLSAHKDKRVLFVIPWRNYSLIGTTDTDYNGSCDEVYADASEVEYLLTEIQRIFPGENLDRKGIITTFASLRPLVNTGHRLTWQISREHLIKESRSGLISVVGGKYTTYRHLAEQVVDLALPRLKGRYFKKCITHTIGPSSPLPYGEKTDLPPHQNLWCGGLPKLIAHAVKEEMANSLIDLFLRRIEFLTTASPGLTHLKGCAEIMAGLLGWPEAKKEKEINLYQEESRKNIPC